MKKLQARIKYEKESDMYVLYTSTNGGETWDYNTGWKCQFKEGREDAVEPEYVHISILGALKRCIAFGYEIVN